MNTSGTPRFGPETAVIVIAPDDLSAEVFIQDTRQVVHGADAKATRRAALDYVAGYATHIGRPVLVEARDAFGVQRLEALPGGVVRGVAETPPPPGAGGKRQRSGGRALLLAAAGGLAVVVLVVAAVVLVVPRLGSDTATPPGETVEPTETVPFEARPAPPGFSTEALWRIPVTDGTRPAVADDGSRVAFIGADGKLAVAGPEGERLWEAELPLQPAEIEGPVRFVENGDEWQVAVAGSQTLWIWPADGGEPVEYGLPEGGVVTFAGSAPLVTVDDKAMLPRDGELVEVEVPEGTGGMLVDGNEVLLASADGPWYWAAPGEEARKVSAVEPKGSEGLDRVITASERYVIVRWQSEKEDRVVLAAHDAHDGSVFAETEVTAGELADATWIEGETVAAYGPILVDLGSGETQLLPGFGPLSATGGVVYGELEESQVAVNAAGEITDMEPDTARPWGLLDGNAVVLADANLYALLPG